MALIVEDGTMPAGANTYANIADADAYFANRTSEAWQDADASAKATALVRATDYLNGLSWRGRKVKSRPMAWPRVDVVDADGWGIADDVVPDAVRFACCDMAGVIVAGADPLAVQDRAIAQMSVGPISVSYADSGQESQGFPAINAMLKGLLRSRSSVRLAAAC